MILIGLKKDMTHVYKDDVVIPVTIVELPENFVVSKRFDTGKDMWLVSVGVGEGKTPGKQAAGQYKASGKVPKHTKQVWVSKEIGDNLEVGQALNIADILKDVLTVNISGKTKGKGFAGVVKRWGFKEGPETRGQGIMKRHPGSIGAQTPGRVFAGKKMAGRMGGDNVKVKNVKLVEQRDNKILLKGGLPGGKGGYIYIETNK